MKYLFSIMTLGILFLTSCSPTLSYFTQDLYEDNRWSGEELQQIQFYLSDDIVLYRDLSDSESKISRGKVILKNGRKVEEVTFKKGTPGIMTFHPKSNRLGVSFEEDDDKFLMFGPNPKAGDRYTLLAKDWNRKVGKITYDNRTYNISSTDAFTALMIDLERVRNTDVNNRTARGRRIE